MGGVLTRDRPAKASSIPRRFTLHREMNRRTTMKRVKAPTKIRATLAGSSRFCISRPRLTLGGKLPDWTASMISGSMSMATVVSGRSEGRFVGEISRSGGQRGTFLWRAVSQAEVCGGEGGERCCC